MQMTRDFVWERNNVKASFLSNFSSVASSGVGYIRLSLDVKRKMTSISEVELQEVIKFCKDLRKKPIQTFKLIKESGINCSRSLVFKWHWQFPDGREDIFWLWTVWAFSELEIENDWGNWMISFMMADGTRFECWPMNYLYQKTPYIGYWQRRCHSWGTLLRNYFEIGPMA